jgi:pimeloyl-ACP methyl ester carboxylesterase
LGGILCSINSTNSQNFKNIRFKFAILICGFKSNQSQHDHFYKNSETGEDLKIQTPSLHIIGEEDKVIPKEAALNLTNYFVEPIVFKHEAGHFIPSNSASKSVYIDFIKLNNK